MTFKAIGLDPAQFASWSALNDAELAQRHARRRVADAQPGFPCRVSLQDAEIGERLILLAYEHHAADSPYRAAGPIFVRERATRWNEPVDVVPPALCTRLLSVRAYDAVGMLQQAEVLEGRELESLISGFFAKPTIEYLHIHFARQGCYACRIERA